MNRETEYRGKRVDDGEWVYGDLINLHNGRKFIIDNRFGACIDDKGNFINTEAPFVNEIIPETVGQYTRKNDKNGTKIFEGDIVKGKFYHSDIGIVEWESLMFKISGMSMCTYFNRDMEVIGNIHDKELEE